MANWNSFGVSEIGPSHISSGKPNQDSWLKGNFTRYSCIAAADGLGSCAHSDVGSSLICQAVVNTVKFYNATRKDFIVEDFIKDVQTRYLKSITPFSIRDCSTTCLFGVLTPAEEVCIAALGDGLAAAVTTHGVEMLKDDKSSGFSNVVSAFSEKTTVSDWKYATFPEKECSAVVLCTDGIADDLENEEGFVKSLVDVYSTKTTGEIMEELYNAINDWPVPKHTDDKTIACMYRKESE